MGRRGSFNHDDPAPAATAGSLTVADGPGPAAGTGSVSGSGSDRPDRAAAGPGSRAAVAARTSGPVTPFADRRAAGRALGERLVETSAPGAALVVLGLPRGGVIVAAEVAAALSAPLDVLVVRKLGLPGQPELAMGAIAAVGEAVETVRVARVLAAAPVEEAAFAEVHSRELAELRRREAAYRGDRPPVPLTGRDVVIVDDGLATGATMDAAVLALRGRHPRSIVVAVPVGSHRACSSLARDVDQLVCLDVPFLFRAVGQGYADFGETTDEEVRAALGRA